MSSTLSAYVAIKIVELMAKPFVEWEAYEMGLIDEDGRKIKHARTREERKQFVSWMNLIRNIKRLLQTVPGGRRKLSSYTAAFVLLKECIKRETGEPISESERLFLEAQWSKVVGKQKLTVESIYGESQWLDVPDPGFYRVVGAHDLSKEDYSFTDLIEITEECRVVARENQEDILLVKDYEGGFDVIGRRHLIPVPELNVTGHIAGKDMPLGNTRRRTRADIFDDED